MVVEVDGPLGTQTLSEVIPGPIPTESLFTYLFTDSINASSVGTYNFTAYLDLPVDPDNQNDTLNWSITRDHIVVSSFPYTEDFNSGAGNWIADSTYHPNRYFELGAVPFLGGPQGYGDSWYTVVNNNGYGDFSVESPVFDFSDLTNPVLSMDIKAEMRSYYGTNVHVEYSTNGGATWATLGDESTPNWYGEFPAYSSYTGWGPTNNSVQSLPDWTHMTQSLCPLAGESCVMFRVLADRRMYSGQMDFAFDNVRIVDGPDFALTQHLQPLSFENCWLDGNTPVEVELYSYMCADTGDIPIVVEVTGPTGAQTLSETIPASISTESLYTLILFTDSIDASLNGTYNFTAYLDLPTDVDPLNDTLNWSITREHIRCDQLPILRRLQQWRRQLDCRQHLPPQPLLRARRGFLPWRTARLRRFVVHGSEQQRLMAISLSKGPSLISAT